MNVNSIEVSLSPSGSKMVYCGRCNEATYNGQQPCCQWMIDMYIKYLTPVRSYPDVLEVEPGSDFEKYLRSLNVSNRALPE